MDKLAAIFSSVLDAFIAPECLDSGAEKVRPRSLVGLLLANLFNLLFIAFALSIFYPFTAAGRQVAALACFATVISLVLALFLVRFTQRHQAATHLLIISIYVPIVLVGASTGGIASPVVPLLVWLPVVAGFLFNWELGLGWLSVAVLTAVGFFVAPGLGFEMNSVVPPANMPALQFAMLIFGLIGVGGFIIAYTLANMHAVREITDQRLKYERLANYDGLTSLPNRMNFSKKLKAAIDLARRAEQRVGLLVMDLNKFKSVNDTYGHSVGDELLHHMARRLIERVRGSDFVARLGGDEFVVIMERVADPNDVASKAKSLINIIEQPYMLTVGKVELGVSVGCAVYPDHEVDEAALFSRADLAMFYAKQRHLGYYMDTTPSQTAEFLKQLNESSERETA